MNYSFVCLILSQKSFVGVLYQPYTNPELYKGCGGITMVDTRQELSVPDLSLITPELIIRRGEA